MKASEIHDLTDDEVAQKLEEGRRELFNLRFQHATGQLENTARLREAKTDLARALTIARQRGIDVETEIRRQSRNG